MAAKSCQLKVILIGDSGVGKSCLMDKYVSGSFDSKQPATIGVNYMNKGVEMDLGRFTVQIWDTSGLERFRAIRTLYYRQSDCCILTFAMDDRASFENLDMWKKEFLRYSDVGGLENYPFIVLANKADCPECLKRVSAAEISEWCQNNDSICCFKISAKDGTNLNEAFETAVRLVVKNSANQMHDKHNSTSVDLRQSSENGWNIGCCCQ